MENESEGLQSALSDHDPFEEWVRHHAAAVGLPEAEFREQVIGAYWAVNELVEMNSPLLSDQNPLETAAPAALGEGAPENPVEPAEQSPAVEEAIIDIRSQIEELRAALSELQAAQTKSTAADLDPLENRIDELEQQIETAASADELAGHVSMLYDRYADLDDDLEALSRAHRENHDGLAEDYHQHRDHVKEELATARTLFEHSLGTTAEHTERLDRFDQMLEGRDTRRRQLAELKDRAAQLGIGSAECGSCGASVNLALLSSPACPSCGRGFHDIDRHVQWFGLRRDRHTLTVDESSAHRRPSSDSEKL